MLKRFTSSLSLRLVIYVIIAQSIILILLLGYRGISSGPQPVDGNSLGVFVALNELTSRHRLPDPSTNYLQSELGRAVRDVPSPAGTQRWKAFLLNSPDLWYVIEGPGGMESYGAVPVDGFERVQHQPTGLHDGDYCEWQSAMNTVGAEPAMHVSVQCKDGVVSYSFGGMNLEYVSDVFDLQKQEWSFLGVRLEFVFYIVLALILFAPLSIFILLRPVRRASAMAESFEIGMDGFALPTESVPSEIVGLIRAVNNAFSRVEEGRQRERNFRHAMAHELRTPLTILRARLDEVEDQPLRQQLVEDVRSMKNLVSRLLDLAEVTSRSDSLRKTDLRDVVTEAVSNCHGAFKAVGQTFALECPDERIDVLIHKDIAVLALVNLIHNAIEHGASDLPVTISLDPFRKISVRDHGPGFVAAKGEDADASLRTNTAMSALYGVGLNIVEGACQAMRAKLSLSHPVEGGLLATIDFSKAGEV